MSAEATPTVEITYTENPIVQSEPVTEIKIIKKDNNFSKRLPAAAQQRLRAKRQLESYELIALKQQAQDEYYKDKANVEKANNERVDVTLTVKDIDYIDPLDASFRCSFSLHAIYSFDEEKQRKDLLEKEAELEAAQKGDGDSVDPLDNDLKADDLDDARSINSKDSKQVAKLNKEEEEIKEDMGVVGFAQEFRRTRDDNIFYKLLRRKEEHHGKLIDVLKEGEKVKINGQTMYCCHYTLDDDEVRRFLKYYNVPVIQVENVKKRHNLDAINWDEHLQITLYHEAPHQHSTKDGVISIMIAKDYEFFLKQVFELHHFPYDYQDLSIELSIDEGEHFDFSINDIRFRKVSLEHPEWVILEPNAIWYNPFASEVNLRAKRKPTYYIQNVVVVLIILTALGIIPFFFDDMDMSGRILTQTTLLLTVVAFKFVLASQIPRTSYNTLLDHYILWSTITVAVNNVLLIIGPLFESTEINTAIQIAFGAWITLFTICWFIAALVLTEADRRNAVKIAYKLTEDSDEMHDFHIEYTDTTEDDCYHRIGKSFKVDKKLQDDKANK